MERRIALAVAASATVMLASATVGAAVFGGVSVLGFGSASKASTTSADDAGAGEKPKVVTRYRDVYDRVLFDTSANSGSAASNRPVELSSARRPEDPAGPETPVATPTSQPAAGSRRPATTRKPSSRKPSTATPTTVATRPPVSATTTTSTSVPTTTTTWPRGVPRDWPPGKPIPPKPPGCRDGKLEDDGRWNCQD